MSKIYRSMLWTGLVVAGVAACGDDVTVQPPPPPPVLTVHSVSVAPNPASVNVAGTLPMVATVNADAGIATTVTWATTNALVATVSGTGVVTGVAAGSVGITACSTVVTSVCGSSSVTVVAAPTATVTSVTVTPPNATLNPAQTLTASASVQGTNNPSQTVTWTSLAPGIATVGAATGVVTGVAAGTAVIRACSTLAGFTTVCGSMSVNVPPVDPAQVQIRDVTFTNSFGQEVPVVLTNVFGQIQINLNVNTGSQQVTRVDALIDGIVVASQSFAVPPAPQAVKADGDEAAVLSVVTLSTNTQQLRRNGTLFLPVVFNGNASITANLYVSTQTAPIASPAVPVVMNNPDAALKVGTAFTLVNNSSSPTFNDGTNDWFTGTQTSGAVNYISFSNTPPTVVPFASSVCGASSSNTVTGTPTTGLSVDATFTCAAVEGGNTVTAVTFGGIAYATLAGPDGTPVVAATGFNNIGTAFCLPLAGNPIFTNLPPGCDANSDQRWNMFTPGTALTTSTAVFVDNKVPTVIMDNVAFNDAFDQDWVNDAYNFLTSDVLSSDAGTGVASEAAFNQLPAAIVCTTTSPVTVGADVANTITSDGTPEGHRLCARATDNIGNVSPLTGFSNFFGKDNVAPSVRLAGSTAATPLIPGTFPTFTAAPANTTIFSIAAPFTATDQWGLEGNDDAAGFNQFVVAGFPANQTMNLLNPANLANPVVACGFTAPMGTILSDNFVRTTHSLGGTALLDCGLGVPGYFLFTGFVTDRAGNQSVTLTENYAIDQYAVPVLASIGPASIFFTAGLPANFFLFGSDDLEIVEADLILTYPGMNDAVATLTSITKSLSAIAGAARWDATITNVLAGASAIDPFLFGRVDLACGAATDPYPGCLALGGPTISAEYNNAAPATNDGKNPTLVGAVAYDVASQPSNLVTAGLLTAQTNDVAEQWSSVTAAGMISWNITSLAGPVVGQWVTTSSLVPPYFDRVWLARENAGATSLILCTQAPAPIRTDNGIQRTFTYTIAIPAVPLPCSAGGDFYLVGEKNGAALLTPAP